MNKEKKSLAESNINELKSRRKGLIGLFENLFRKFPTLVSFLSSSPMIIIYILCISISCTPGIWLCLKSFESSQDWSLFSRSILMALSFSTGGFLFVVSLILVVPLFNIPFKIWLRRNGKYKGPWLSIQTIPWYMHNALIYLVRYTVLDFITPSILNELFFRLMGMKIGKNVMINSSNISDACLIELEDNVTVGGSAVLMAHYGMHGLLVLDELKIGKKTTIGLNAMVFGGCKIGERVTVGPNSVIYPKDVIESGRKVGIKSHA